MPREGLHHLQDLSGLLFTKQPVDVRSAYRLREPSGEPQYVGLRGDGVEEEYLVEIPAHDPMMSLQNAGDVSLRDDLTRRPGLAKLGAENRVCRELFEVEANPIRKVDLQRATLQHRPWEVG